MFGRVMNTSLHILGFRFKYFLIDGAFNDCEAVKRKKETNEQRLQGYYKYQLLT